MIPGLWPIDNHLFALFPRTLQGSDDIPFFWGVQITVKTFFGLETVLAAELEALGATNIQPLTRAVSCEGDVDFLYRANLWLRTALRVLVPIKTFEARNEEDLYRSIYNLDWTKWTDVDRTIAIDSTVSSDVFRHSKYVALKAKDAIVDQFRERFGRRPSIDTEHPNVRINLHVTGTQVTVSLDSSGGSLHRRGYRDNGHRAPINEVLAAGLVLWSGWDQQTPLMDGMCGSGTILFEAALLAANQAPGLKRRRFGFMSWPDFDKTLWDKIYTQAITSVRPVEVELYGSDISSRALDQARDSAYRFKLPVDINWKHGDFRQLPAPATGLLIMNPPYGERLNPRDVNELYQTLGDTLKQRYTGSEAWVLSSNRDALKHVGLRPSRRLTLYNGALECKFQKYEMYSGKR